MKCSFLLSNYVFIILYCQQLHNKAAIFNQKTRSCSTFLRSLLKDKLVKAPGKIQNPCPLGNKERLYNCATTVNLMSRIAQPLKNLQSSRTFVLYLWFNSQSFSTSNLSPVGPSEGQLVLSYFFLDEEIFHNMIAVTKKLIC